MLPIAVALINIKMSSCEQNARIFFMTADKRLASNKRSADKRHAFYLICEQRLAKLKVCEQNACID